MPSWCRASRLAVVLFAVAAAAAAQNAVIVQPGADQTASLQAAIDAATDGDILVLAGTWIGDVSGAAVTVQGKGLVLVAAAGNAPALRQLHVLDLPAGSTVLVRGLQMPVPPNDLPMPPARLWFENCAGGVWLEDCGSAGQDSIGFGLGSSFPALPPLSAHDCAALNLERCNLSGGNGVDEGGGGIGFHPASFGATAADITNCALSARECTLTGGRPGKALTASISIKAGAGLHVVGGSALLAGSALRGGDDVDSSTEPGPGLLAQGAVSVARRGATILAGTGAPVVADVIAPPGSVSEYAAPTRSIEIDAPLHEQQPGTLRLHGQPGDLLLLLAGSDGAGAPLPGRQGVLSLAAPVQGPFVLGVITSPTGEWDIPFTAPDLLQPQWLGFTTLLQLASVSGGKGLLEGTTAFVLLDSSLP